MEHPQTSERFQLIDQTSGEPIRNLSYFLELNNGAYVYGKTNDEGLTDIAVNDVPINIRCYWGKEARKRIMKVNGSK